MANQAAGVSVGSPGMTRREFLYYIWGASMALVTLEATGLLIWFMIPRFREGEFGGKFTLAVDVLPAINGEPADFPEGRFWLSNLDTDEPNERMFRVEDDPSQIKGVAAIYKVCTHLGCIYAWTPANDRFECPCHGSKYRLDGRRIESPAPRTLDRFALAALDINGTILAEAQADSNGFYEPLDLPEGTAFIQIDTGSRADGPTQRLICDFFGNCP